MTDHLLEQDDASTPLTHEEREGLIPSYITLRSELNEAEQSNILEAAEWAFARKRDVLDERLLTNLHQRMFGRVWRWAGQFRTTDRNIGVDPYRIPVDLPVPDSLAVGITLSRSGKYCLPGEGNADIFPIGKI